MRTHTEQKHKQRGSAVIAALLVVALVAALLLLIQVVHHASIVRTTDVIAYEKAYTFALGIEEWAIGRLSDYQKLPIETRAKQTWPITLPIQTEDGNEFFGEIIEQQAKLNLNSLANSADLLKFNAFLKTVLPGSSDVEPTKQSIAQYLQDKYKIDDSDEDNDDDAAENTNATWPIRLIIFPSEIQSLRGMPERSFAAMLPYITALPASDPKINVNTASLPVLMTIHRSMTEAIAQNFITERQRNGGFISTNEAKTLLVPAGVQAPAMSIDVAANYFLVHAHIKRGEIELDLYSFLSVTTQQDQVKVKVLWRSQSYL